MLAKPYNLQDAEYRDNIEPSGFDAVAGYIGGSAANIWTNSDFWSLDHALRRLPIWVGAVGGIARISALADASAAVARLRELTVHPGRVVALDMETAVDPRYVLTFGHIVANAGYMTWVYGSLDFVFRNPPLDGYWVADYDHVTTKPAHPMVVAKQYANGQSIDRSVIYGGANFRHLW